MPTYRMTVVGETTYEVEAESEQEARSKALNGEGRKVDFNLFDVVNEDD